MPKNIDMWRDQSASEEKMKFAFKPKWNCLFFFKIRSYFYLYNLFYIYSKQF